MLKFISRRCISKSIFFRSLPSGEVPCRLNIFCYFPVLFGKMNMPIEAIYQILRGFPGVSEVKSPPANVGDVWDSILITGSGRYPQRRKWQYNPGFLPGRSQGQRSLEGCRPWGPKELETTERLSTQVPIKSRNGEGRGKQPQSMKTRIFTHHYIYLH